MKRLNVRLILILSASIVVAGVCLFGLQRCQVDRHAQGLLRRADLAESDGEVREAISHLGRYVQQRPDDHDALARMALLREQTTHERQLEPLEFHATWQLLERAIRLNPEHFELRKRTAEFYLRHGRSKDAISHLETLRSRSEDPQLQLSLARAFLGVEKVKEAQEILEAMIGYRPGENEFNLKLATDPLNVDAYAMLAAIYRNEPSQNDRADRVMQQCITVNADSAPAHLARGRHLLASAGKSADIGAQQEEAKNEIRTAAQLSPDDADVIAAMANLETSQKNLTQAKSWLERGIDKHPTREEFYRSRAGIALLENHPNEAAEFLRAGLKALPNSWPLLLMRAEVDLSNGNFQGTREAAAKLRGDERFAVLADYLEAQTLLAERKWSESSRQFEKLLPQLTTQRPDLRDDAYLALARCYEQMGQSDQQREANRQLLALEPTSLAGRFSEVRALARLGRAVEAKRELEIVKRIAKERNVDLPDLNKWEITLLAAEQGSPGETPRDNAELRKRFLAEVNARNDLTAEQKAAIHVRFLIQQKDRGEADKFLQQSLAQSPDSEVLQLVAVDLAQLDEDTDRASGLLGRLEKEHGDKVEYRLRRALLIAGEQGDQTMAQLRPLEENTDKFSTAETSQLFRGLAAIYLKLDQPKQTLRLWKQATESEPENLSVRVQMFELARAQRDLKLMDEVGEEIQRIAGEKSAYSYFVQAHQRLATAEGEPNADDITAVRALLRQAQAVRPKWHALSLLHADLDLREGDTHAAVEHLQAALEQGPASAPVVRRLVELLWSQQRFDEARLAIDRLSPQAAATIDGRIRSQFELADGDLTSAVEVARSTAKTSSDPADHLWLGRLLARDGQAEQAIAAYRQAVTLEPANEQSRLLLLRALIQDNRRDEAEAEVRNIALHADPRRADSILGIAYEMLGESLLARRHFQQAALARPHDPAALRDLAAFYLLAKDSRAASAQIDRILKLPSSPASGPHHVWARRTKARLIGGSGRYADFQRAVELLQENATAEVLPREDLLLLAELSLPRDDPFALQQAIAQFEVAAAARQASPMERLAHGRLLAAVGKWNDCEQVMSALVADEPENEPLILTWCEMQLRHGGAGNVETLLRPLDATSPAVQRVRARLFALAGRQERAAEIVLSMAPPPDAQNRLAAMVSLGRFLEDLQLNADAERFYRAAVQESPELTLELAAYLARAGKLESAFDLCESQLNDRTLLAVTRIGIMGLTAARAELSPDSPQLAQVETWLARGLRELPDSKLVLLHHAYLCELKADHRLAAELYRRYLSRTDLTFSERAIAANNLAMLLAGLEQCADARRHIDEAIALVGPTAAMLDTRAIVALCEADNDAAVQQAVDDLQLALAVSAEPVIGLHLAFALQRSGDVDAAERTLKDALADGLKHEELSPHDRSRYDILVKTLAMESL